MPQLFSKPVAALTSVVLFAASGGAQATLAVYTTQAAFAAATVAPGTDTFADMSVSDPTGAPLARTAGGYAYTASVDSGWFFAGGTAQNPFLAPNTSTDTMRITGFGGGVQAAGGLFFGADLYGQYALGDITVTAFDASGSVTRTLVGATSTSFLGFVSSDKLLGLNVTAVQPVADYLWPALDNLVLASVAAVPEPQSWAFLLAGMAVLIVFRSAAGRKATPTADYG